MIIVVMIMPPMLPSMVLLGEIVGAKARFPTIVPTK